MKLPGSGEDHQVAEFVYAVGGELGVLAHFLGADEPAAPSAMTIATVAAR
jgi:hypothetical protein